VQRLDHPRDAEAAGVVQMQTRRDAGEISADRIVIGVTQQKESGHAGFGSVTSLTTSSSWNRRSQAANIVRVTRGEDDNVESAVAKRVQKRPCARPRRIEMSIVYPPRIIVQHAVQVDADDPGHGG
jgi:hypothetical protein